MNSTNGHQALVIVPSLKGKQLKFMVFQVDAGELSAFLPADEVLKTDNFYAANTFIKGFYLNRVNDLPEGPQAKAPVPGKLL